MYDKIYEFCKSKNPGSAWKNGPDPTPRVEFLIGLLEELGIQFELDRFSAPGRGSEENWFYNLYLPGESSHMVSAHHDIVNPYSDNANDNSASVICAIALKLEQPELKVVLLDGEEVGGIGSQRVADRILKGELGRVDWVLNLELSGIGGKRFFIGDYPGPLQSRILQKFGCPVISTPFNDSVIFRRNGIDSCVINPVPALDGSSQSEAEIQYLGEGLDLSILGRCHSLADSLDQISCDQMQEYVEKVLVPICRDETKDPD